MPRAGQAGAIHAGVKRAQKRRQQHNARSEFTASLDPPVAEQHVITEVAPSGVHLTTTRRPSSSGEKQSCCVIL